MALAGNFRIYTPILKVDGGLIIDDYHQILEISVDRALFLPGMFTIMIQDQAMDLNTLFKLGSEIYIEIGETMSDESLAESRNKPLIEGVVTGWEYTFGADGKIVLQVRGYEHSYKLTQGKQIRSFLNKTDAQMAQEVIGNRSLTASVDPSREQHENFIQYNQTDWEFLLSRARRLGYIISSEKKTVTFKKPASKAPITLQMGTNLISFEPKLSLLGQLSKTTATGWDYMEKKAITGTAAAAGKDYHTQNQGSKEIKKVTGEVVDYLLDQPLPISNGAAKAAAQSQLDQAESQYFQAEGISEGDPDLQPAQKVKIESGAGFDIGSFAGNYVLTHVRHIYTQGNFTTWFKISGASVESLSYLLNPFDPADQPRINGVVPALVTNNNDPNKIGRVKVKYPWLPKVGGTEIESGWARVAVPGGGKERGMYFPLEVDDEVLVAFDHGDINSPYVIGGLYQNKDKPPIPSNEAIKGGVVNQRIIKTRSGHTLKFSDEKGKEMISIIDKTGKNSIEIDTAKNSLTLKAEGDIVLDAGGKLTMKSKSDFSVDTKAAGKINTTGALNVESKQAATIKGTTGATIQGLKVDVKADTNASLQGSAMVEVKGAMVKIN